MNLVFIDIVVQVAAQIQATHMDGNESRIESHKNVWCNATAAVNEAACGSSVYGTGVNACRITMNDFAIVITVYDFFVVSIPTFVIWFLYAPSQWGVISCNGQPQFTAVIKFKWLLY